MIFFIVLTQVQTKFDHINLFSKKSALYRLCHTVLQNQSEVLLLYLSSIKKINSTYFVFWQFVSFNADLTLVTDSKRVKFHFVKLHGIWCGANHQITLSALDHVARTLKGVYLIIGHWYIFFTEKINKTF